MKQGTTPTLDFKLDIEISNVTEVVFTFTDELKYLGTSLDEEPKYLLQKNYPDDVTFEDDTFKLPLTQEETDLLTNTFFVEAQVICDKAVVKSDIKKVNMPHTLWTTYVDDNESNGQSEVIHLSFSDYVKVEGGSTGDYTDLTNKPRINNIELIGNKTTSDLGLDIEVGDGLKREGNVVSVDLKNGESVLGFDNGKLKSDLSAYYTKSESDNKYQNKLTVGNGIDISNDEISIGISSLSSNILDFESGKLWLNTNALPSDTGFRASMPYDEIIRQRLTEGNNSPLQPKLTAGTNITIDSNNVISASGGGLSYTFTDGLVESSGTVGIDLASGSKLLIDSNDKLDVDLSSKQDTIDNNNKLDADLVDDSTSTNKFVTAQEKQGWDDKADDTVITTDTTSTTVTLTLADNNEYRYTTDLTSLTLTMPSGDFIASVVFASGSTPTSMTYDSSIKWSGDDVTSNAFVPVANKTYNIIFWYDGININAISRSA